MELNPSWYVKVGLNIRWSWRLLLKSMDELLTENSINHVGNDFNTDVIKDSRLFNISSQKKPTYLVVEPKLSTMRVITFIQSGSWNSQLLLKACLVLISLTSLTGQKVL